MNFNMSFGEKPSSHGRNYYLCLHALNFLCFLDICIILILLLEIINTFNFLLHSTLGMPLFEKKKPTKHTHSGCDLNKAFSTFLKSSACTLFILPILTDGLFLQMETVQREAAHYLRDPLEAPIRVLT